MILFRFFSKLKGKLLIIYKNMYNIILSLYNRYYQSPVEKFANKLIEDKVRGFDKLAMEQQVKQRLKERIVFYEANLVNKHVKRFYFFNLFAPLVALFMGIALSFFVTKNIFNSIYNDADISYLIYSIKLANVPLGIVFFIAIFIYLVIIAPIFLSRFGGNISPKFIKGWTIISSLTFTLLGYILIKTKEDNMFNILMSFSIFCLSSTIYACFALLYFYSTLYRMMVEISMRKHFPVSMLFTNLTFALSTTKGPRDWESIDDRKEQLQCLERAARCVETYLPRYLASDSITDKWYKDVCKEFATALREKKKWLLTPRIDTYNHFVESILFILICICDNNWDALEKVKLTEEEEKHIHTLLWRSRIANLVRAIFVAVSPLIAFELIFLTPLVPQGTFRDLMVGGALWWGLLTIINVFDPGLSSRLSQIKGVVDLLLPVGKGHKE